MYIIEYCSEIYKEEYRIKELINGGKSITKQPINRIHKW